MSVDKYISEAIKAIDLPRDKRNRVNQAVVLGQAEEILKALYTSKLCLFIESPADADFFLEQFATGIASIFPRKKAEKKKAKKKNKDQQKAGKAKWEEFGINFYRTTEFKGFSQATQKAYRAAWEKIYPYYACDEDGEKKFREPGGPRHFRTKEFKSSKKADPEFVNAYQRDYPGMPVDEFTYQVFLREHHTHQGPVKFNYRKGKDSQSKSPPALTESD